MAETKTEDEDLKLNLMQTETEDSQETIEGTEVEDLIIS